MYDIFMCVGFENSQKKDRSLKLKTSKCTDYLHIRENKRPFSIELGI